MIGRVPDWPGWPGWPGWPNVPNLPNLPAWPDRWGGWRESFEREAASGAERMVAGEGFSELLVQLTQGAVGLSKITADFWDMTLRNLRLAGRADIDRLARQLASSEDKLELVLQRIEALQDERLGNLTLGADRVAGPEDRLDR